MTAKNTPPNTSNPAAQHITDRIRELGDWRGATLGWVRSHIHAADPEIQEQWKWRGVPVWAHGGGICTGETYKEVVKLTFFRGAALADPHQLFNSSLEGNTRRAIDIHQGETLDAAAFKALIHAAIDANAVKAKAKTRTKTKAKAPATHDAATHALPSTAKATKGAKATARSTSRRT